MSYVSISGNTGAGKSTLVRALALGVQLPGDREGIVGVDERSLHHPMLQRMFDSPRVWGLSIQMNFLVARATTILKFFERKQPFIMERSLSEDRIFAERLAEQGAIPLRGIVGYRMLHDELSAQLPSPSGHIFLRCPPAVSIARLEEAMRTGRRPVEVTGQSLHVYVHDMAARYERWHSEVPAGGSHLTVDASRGVEQLVGECLVPVEAWLRE